MKQDEIIDMAQECGLIGMRPHLDGIYSEALVAFAKLVAEKALSEHAMQEVQRLGQEIEQEPVAWITPDGEGFRIRFSPPTNDVPLGWDALYTTPPKEKK